MRWIKRISIAFLMLSALGAGGFFVLGPGITEKMQNRIVPHEPWPVSPNAAALHKSLAIADWHSDSLMWNRDLLQRGSYGHVDFPRLAEGNVALQVFTTVTKSPAGLNYELNSSEARDNITLVAIGQLWPIRTWTSRTERALYQSQKLHEFQARSPDTFRIIRTKNDLKSVMVTRAAGQPLIGAMMGAEGGHALDGDIANLERLYDAGFRLMGLTHFFDNELGGSLHGHSDAGLTDFGRQVVTEMVKKHMIIDLAHTSPKMAAEVLDMVDVPVIVSHTGIFGHCQTKRNFPDELMQKIATAGGLLGMGYWADVTCDASPDGVAKSIMAAIAVVGVDHVSLGSDYDGAVETTYDTSELAALTDALLRQGLPDAAIAKVMGGNMIDFLARALPD